MSSLPNPKNNNHSCENSRINPKQKQYFFSNLHIVESQIFQSKFRIQTSLIKQNADSANYTFAKNKSSNKTQSNNKSQFTFGSNKQLKNQNDLLKLNHSFKQTYYKNPQQTSPRQNRERCKTNYKSKFLQNSNFERKKAINQSEINMLHQIRIEEKQTQDIAQAEEIKTIKRKRSIQNYADISQQKNQINQYCCLIQYFKFLKGNQK